MSAIFKSRKVPKHLIIQEELDFRRKPRFSFWRITFWLVVLGLLTLVFVQFGFRF